MNNKQLTDIANELSAINFVLWAIFVELLGIGVFGIIVLYNIYKAL